MFLSKSSRFQILLTTRNYMNIFFLFKNPREVINKINFIK